MCNEADVNSETVSISAPRDSERSDSYASTSTRHMDVKAFVPL